MRHLPAPASSRVVVAVSIGIFLAVVSAPRLFAQFPSASFQAPSRICGQSGSKLNRIALHGTDLDELRGWWFSNTKLKATQIPAVNTRMVSNSNLPNVHFDLEIPQDVQPGVYESWAISRFGVSNSRRFVVVSKPVVDIRSEKAEAATPIELRVDCVYEGQFAARNRHYFEIELDRGEHLEVGVYAQVVDSQGVPRVACFDPTGHEECRTRATGSWPASFSLTAESDGIYQIVVSDFLFRGGIDFPFLLEAVVAEPAKKPKSELPALLAPVLAAIPTRAEPNSGDSKLADEDGRVLPGGDVARYMTRKKRPPRPIISASSSAVLRAPFMFAGELSKDQWSLDFNAEAGADYWIEIQSQSWDQITDIELILFELSEQNGMQVAKRLTQQDDPRGIQGIDVRSFSRDPLVHWQPPNTGRYRILLIDHIRSQDRSEAKAFRLEVRRSEPGFSLLAFPVHLGLNPIDAKPKGLTLMQNGTQAVQIRALRQDGFNGPIEIVALSSRSKLPASIGHARTILASGQNECTLVLSHDPRLNMESGHNSSDGPIPLKIMGRPVADVQADESHFDDHFGSAVEASYASVNHPKSTQRTRPQARLTSQLPLYVNPHDQAPIRFELGDSSSIQVEQDSSCEIPLQVRRIDAAKVTTIARAKNLPPKTTCADVTIGADTNEVKATIKIAKDTPIGEYTVWMQCETKLNWARNPQALNRLGNSLEEAKKKLAHAKESNVDMAKVKQLEMSVAEAKTAVENQTKLSTAKPLTVWIPSTACCVRVVKPASSE